MGRFHTIARDSGLFYYDEGCTDAVRFTEVFLKTWQEIPFMDRRSMTLHWRRLKMQWLTSPVSSPLLSRPRMRNWSLAEVRVVDFLPDREASCVEMLGRYLAPRKTGAWPQFVFWHHAVNDMTDRALSSLIARELACAFVAATDEKLSASNMELDWDLPDFSDDANDCPDTAHDVLAEWGFSTTLLDDWCQNHFATIENALMAVPA